MTEYADIAIVGAGAAGLMAAIWAGRSCPGARIIVLDGAKTLGIKILVAGGGRCNVTHDVVDESAFAGSSRHAIKKVLRRFDAAHTVAFFHEIGVDLKREETGKLFPTTDSARTVLDALLNAVRVGGAEIRHPWRVASITPPPSAAASASFRLTGTAPDHSLLAGRVVLATGGRSLPRSGSDGGGYELARSLGHSITDRVFPALVPLTLPRDHLVCALSGLTLEATLEVRAASGKRLVSFTGSTLCTHFGLSGPAPLDISRYYIDAKRDEEGARLVVNWLPGMDADTVSAALLGLGATPPGRWMRDRLPERLARGLCESAGVDPSMPGAQLTREQRRALCLCIAEMALPITGDRGYTYAEATAGGVPLSELRLEMMESRLCAGLHIIGEMCDVDGRIGGYNFQWAWSSGFVAGSAMRGLAPRAAEPSAPRL